MFLFLIPNTLTFMVELQAPARQVTREEAEKFAEELKMRYMETSAKTGENVEETFMLTAREIKAKGVPKPKPSAAQTVNTAAAPEQKPGKGCAC